MSKQLEKLTEKALRTGFANLNGRSVYSLTLVQVQKNGKQFNQVL